MAESTKFFKVAKIGSIVTFKMRGRFNTYCLSSPFDANLEKEKISIESPIGQALLGCRVGEKISVKLPDNSTINCEIIDIK